MSVVVFDAGALVALERNQRSMWADLEQSVEDRDDIQVPTVVLAEVWRDIAQQARLNMALKHCKFVPLSEQAARIAGRLLWLSDITDVADAIIVAGSALASHLDYVTIYTSDHDDISELLHAADLLEELGLHDIRVQAV